jgi:hypothetical protein
MLYTDLFMQFEAVRWRLEVRLNLSLLFKRTFTTVQDLNRFRRSLA